MDFPGECMTGSQASIDTALRGLDPEVLDMLRSDLPHQHDAIITALNAGKLQDARDVVHSVNGSASFCRLHELQSAAAALESDLDQQREHAVSRDAFFVALEATLRVLRQSQ
jgi:HPt (histidine-containing phosphotransfer) domain-containing protein